MVLVDDTDAETQTQRLRSSVSKLQFNQQNSQLFRSTDSARRRRVRRATGQGEECADTLLLGTKANKNIKVCLIELLAKRAEVSVSDSLALREEGGCRAWTRCQIKFRSSWRRSGHRK